MKWIVNIGANGQNIPTITPEGDIIVGSSNGYIYRIGSVRPDPPGIGSVTDVGEGVEVVWDPPAFDGGEGITSYNIYRGGFDEEKNLIGSVQGDVTSYLDDTVAVGEYYVYSVTAVNKRGESDHSIPVPIDLSKVPEPPTGFRARTGSEFVQLDWSAPVFDGGRDLIGFEIYRGEGEGDLEKFTFRTAQELSYNDTTVANGISYRYKLTARNSNGESIPTDIISIMPQGLPYEPFILSAVPGDGQVLITWDPPLSDEGSEIISYTLFRGGSPSGMAEFKVLDPVTQYLDAEVENGLTYYYSLLATNGIGDSGMSNTVSAKPLGRPGPPTEVGIKGAPGYLEITWKDPVTNGGTIITRFNIFRSMDGGPWLSLETTYGSVFSYRDTSAEGGRSYAYELSATNDVGESDRSTAVVLTHQEVSTRPDGLIGTGGDGFVLISWDPPGSMRGSTLLGYRIFRGTTLTNMRQIAEVGPDTVSYNDTDVINGNEYIYHLRAICDVWGTQTLSDQSESMTLEPVKAEAPVIYERPSPPESFDYTAERRSLILKWELPESDGNASILGYIVYKSADGGPFIRLDNVSPLDLDYTDDNISYDVVYRYYVTAYNEYGESDPSNSFEYVLDSPPAEENEGSLLVPIVVVILILAGIAAGAVWIVIRSKKKEAQGEAAESVDDVFSGN